ncbi:MAG: hypothetical protein EA378_03440 [Phycisphaerales bacterium]|nr:MAG: hypothetical protein EA378_03440 [Phycisphaerales bacterium]
MMSDVTGPAGEGGAGGGGGPVRASSLGDDAVGRPIFQRRYREVTVSAIVFGVIFGAIMNAAITYAGLKIGFTIVGSAIAAVLGFGVLRGLLRRGTILETNIGQTIASAVNTPNSGVIFTVPVLLLIGIKLDPGGLNFWLITLACVAGAILGCAFIVPLRKQMLDIDRLRFPSAVGVATILKSPGAGAKKSLVLIAGIAVSALIALPAQLPNMRFKANPDDRTSLVQRDRMTAAEANRLRELSQWQSQRRPSPERVAAGRRLHDHAGELSASDAYAFDAYLVYLQDLAGSEAGESLRLPPGSGEPTDLASFTAAFHAAGLGGVRVEALAGEPEEETAARYEALVEARLLDAWHLYRADRTLASSGSEGVELPAGLPTLELLSWSAFERSYWPRVPLVGYQDLGLRLPMPTPPAPAPTRPLGLMDEGQLEQQALLEGVPVESLRERASAEASGPEALAAHERAVAEAERARARYDRIVARNDRAGDGQGDYFVTDNMVDVGRVLGLPSEFQLVFAIAPFAIGAGFLSGKAGLMVLGGGILAYFVLNPVSYNMGWLPATVSAEDAPGFAFNSFNRPLGIGLLLGGALMGVVFSLPAIREALKSIARSGGGTIASAGGKGRDELGLKTLIIAAATALVLLFFAADFVGNMPINQACPVTEQQVEDRGERVTADYRGYALAFATPEARDVFTNEWSAEQRAEWLASTGARPGWLHGINSHLRAAIIAVVGALWIWFAGIIIAQCTGMTDWSPISGMALLTVVLVLLLAGTGAVTGAVLIGAALCVAITCAADMMADLKTGYLVGAQPRRQQVVEMIFTGIGPIITMFVILLIAQVNLNQGLPAMGPGTETSAPQAQALQAVITGVQGGDMPYTLYGFGALLGVLLGLGSFPGLGVLIGLSVYLPFFYIATYGIGCVANIVTVKTRGKAWSEAWGVPFAAGLIVGESILSLLINMIVLITG